MNFFRSFIASCVIIFLLGSIAAGTVLHLGIYNVSALQQHTGIVYDLLEYARIRSVSTRSRTDVPNFAAIDWQQSGMRLYQSHCKQCHGAPGVSPDTFAMGMMPAPSPIAKIAQERTAEEISWVVTHGIKMSGMPAWKYHLNDEQIWQIVALVEKMPTFTAHEYSVLANNINYPIEPISDRSPTLHASSKNERLKRGRLALQQYDCTGCHDIPGIVASKTHVGPPLGGIKEQIFLAGILPMNPRTLKQWIRFPQELKPLTLMPSMGVPEEHAELMVEYLLSDKVNPK